MCGSSQTSNLNFCFGLSFGLVIAFLIASFTTIRTPLVLTQYSSNYIRSPTGGAVTKSPSSRNTSLDYDNLLHDELDKKIGKVREIQFNDAHMHHDDDRVAKNLSNSVRVLCWIMTGPQNLETKAIHVKRTWGKRCNILLFFSSVTNKTFPTIGLNVSEGRGHLTAKTMLAFRYVFKHYFDKADWFMKADDDTYVIVENLRYFLSSHSPKEPVYFGHHFKTIVKQGYYSGGAGYVLSKEALRRFAEGSTNKQMCREDGGAEDAEIGHCMQNLGVRTENTTDKLGRSRFHCFDPETHIFGGYPDWYYQYDANGAKKGTESISDYAVSFHYVPPNKMYALEFYIYHLRPYGIETGHQDLNNPHPKV